MKIEPGLEDRAKKLADFHSDTVFGLIGASFQEISHQRLVASFSLNRASQQIFGLMHGGIYLYLAESLASLGGWLGIDLDSQICVGIEVNANHLKAVSKQGEQITATATPLHPGKTVQVWQVEFRNQNKDLVSVSRCTLLIRDKLIHEATPGQK